MLYRVSLNVKIVDVVINAENQEQAKKNAEIQVNRMWRNTNPQVQVSWVNEPVILNVLEPEVSYSLQEELSGDTK